MFDFFKHKFFGATRAIGETADDHVAATLRKLERNRQTQEMRHDLAEHRKLEWLRTQRPRLTRGKSGFWWCVSYHPGPSGHGDYPRIGSGQTPRAAYDAWMNY